MRRHLPKLIGAALLGATLAAAAQNKPAATSPPRPPIEFLLGGEQWQPGHRFRAGSDWLALVCSKTECRFEAARLTLRRQQWQGHYDDQPTHGQKLTPRRLATGSGTALAWFRVSPALPWLQPGPVLTYAARGFTIQRPPSEGTLERLIDLPVSGPATLVPLYDSENQRFVLQLRAAGRRQLLEQLGACSQEVNADYLVWAGDFDHDGRPDYLIDFADELGEAKLYLGRDAGPGEIAGLAASYVPPPYGGECDGGGWLPP